LQEVLEKDGDFLNEIIERILQELMEEERNQQVGVFYIMKETIPKERQIEAVTNPVLSISE